MEDFWAAEDKNAKVTVGGDELLPLLIYVVIKGSFNSIFFESKCLSHTGNVPHLYSEAYFMQDFIDDASSKQKQGMLWEA